MTNKDLRILIVDDEKVNVTILNDILKDDYQIKVAMNGEQALELADSDPKPDLILLDIVMPGMDGFEVCQKLKNNAKTSHIPIIFITSMSSQENEIKGLEFGGVDFISKPIEPAIVKARVKNHLMLLQQKYQTDPQYSRHNLSKQDSEKFCVRLESYMEEEKPFLDDELKLKDLADLLEIPTHHLSIIINRDLGMNFYQFLNQYRVNEAKKLLESSDKNLKVLRIGYQAGFQSKASFNQIFKKLTGLTPTQYREKFKPKT